MIAVRRICPALAAAAFGAVAPADAVAQSWLANRSLELHLERIVAVCLVCIALAVAAAVLVKRTTKGRANLPAAPWFGGAKSSGVTVLESRRLGPHAEVCRLTYEGREYLVIVSQGGATLLKEGPFPIEPGQ
jgi:hypothetical protein